MMNNYRHHILNAVDYIRGNIKDNPKIGILTGTGLGNCTKSLDISASLEYKTIPHFPVSAVEGHAGKLVFGRIKNKNIVVMLDRFHFYEGYSPLEVAFPIRVFQKLDVKILILTNASGGIHPDFKPGDIMIISDHINLTGANPLVGPNEDRWGPRFPDMTRAYDTNLAGSAGKAGADIQINLKKGIYAGLKGPSLETPAEILFLRTAGADAVGFSTVLETIAAVHGGMKVLGLSVITNVHDPDAPVPAAVEDILAVAQKAAPKLEKIITGVISRIP